MSHSKTPTRTKLAHAKNGAKRPGKPGNIPSPVIRAGTKQDAVLTLLRQPKGTTIAAIMKATGRHDAGTRVPRPSFQSFTDDKGRATVSSGLRSAATPQIISIMAARTISAEPNR
jgi:Protein of unknown function (DUF3489)